MSVATLPTPPSASVRSGPLPAAPPAPKVWTVDQFHYLGDLGLFEGRRAKLVNGTVIEEGPMNPPHAIALELIQPILASIFAAGWRIRFQSPLPLGLHLDPMPDVAVLPGSPRGAVAHPTTAPFVIEVADTSLAYDTTDKAELYATAGVADYWVLDADGRRLLVFRDPAPLPAGLGATAYRSHLTLGPADDVSPLAAPTAFIRVSDLLP